MARTRLPWFQLWAEEWLLDREVMRLSAAHQGILIHLFCVSWVHGEIAKDDVEPIAAALRVSADDVHGVLSQFYDKSGERWTHHRQAEAMAEQERLRQQRSNAGRTSAQRALQRSLNERSTIEIESQIQRLSSSSPGGGVPVSEATAVETQPQYPARDPSAIVSGLTAAKRRQA